MMGLIILFLNVCLIQKYYKSPQIAVIDSNSPDKSYFKKLKKKKSNCL